MYKQKQKEMQIYRIRNGEGNCKEEFTKYQTKQGGKYEEILVQFLGSLIRSCFYIHFHFHGFSLF